MDAEGQPWVRFEVAGQQAAFPAETVVEVVKLPQLSRVPLMPAYVVGAFLYRGKIVPVIDLRRAAEKTVSSTPATRQRVIVCCAEGCWLGFMIDRLIQIATLNGPVENDTCIPPWSMLQGCVSGCVKGATTPVFLLNLTAIIQILCNETPAYGGSRV